MNEETEMLLKECFLSIEDIRNMVKKLSHGNPTDEEIDNHVRKHASELVKPTQKAKELMEHLGIKF